MGNQRKTLNISSLDLEKTKMMNTHMEAGKISRGGQGPFPLSLQGVQSL